MARAFGHSNFKGITESGTVLMRGQRWSSWRHKQVTSECEWRRITMRSGVRESASFSFLCS